MCNVYSLQIVLYYVKYLNVEAVKVLSVHIVRLIFPQTRTYGDVRAVYGSYYPREPCERDMLHSVYS